MKRIFLLICLILPTYAFAQDAKLQNTSADRPVTAPEKPKPVILDAAKLQELRLVTLEQENIELKAKVNELQRRLERYGELSETLAEMGFMPR